VGSALTKKIETVPLELRLQLFANWQRSEATKETNLVLDQKQTCVPHWPFAQEVKLMELS
jgi:hypothetical protein